MQITCWHMDLQLTNFIIQLENHQSPIKHYITGQEIGMFLIALGFVTLAFATIQHKKRSRI